MSKLEYLGFSIVDQFGVLNLCAISEISSPNDSNPIEWLTMPTLLPEFLTIEHVNLV